MVILSGFFPHYSIAHFGKVVKGYLKNKIEKMRESLNVFVNWFGNNVLKHRFKLGHHFLVVKWALNRLSSKLCGTTNKNCIYKEHREVEP